MDVTRCVFVLYLNSAVERNQELMLLAQTHIEKRGICNLLANRIKTPLAMCICG